MSWLRHPVLGGALMALLLAAAAAAHRTGWELPGVERLERWTLDLRFKLRGPIAPGGETAVVTFDDRTGAADPSLFGRRAGWAKVIRAAKDAGAKVIGVDALFEHAEELLPKELADQVAAYVAAHPKGGLDPEGARLIAAIHRELQGDAELAEALRYAGNVVLSLHAWSVTDLAEPDPTFAKARYGQSVSGDPPPREAGGWLASLPTLRETAKGMGFVTAWEDDTRTVRDFTFALSHQGAVYAPLAVQLVARYLEVPRGKVTFASPLQRATIGDRQVSLAADKLWLNFRGPSGTFPSYSAIDLVTGKLPRGALEGKMVLLGVTRLGYDRVNTPFGADFPGVELNATVIDNLLRADPLRRSSFWLDALLTLAVGLAITLLFWPGLLPSPALQLGGAALALAAFLAITYARFASAQTWHFWMGPLASFVFVGGACLSLSYLGEGLQKRRLRKVFAHYLSDSVIRELLQNPQRVGLGGERRALTVLFSDIRDFTTLSEKLPPDRLVSLLNAYLTPMTRAVLAQGGLLDKYIGDAIMAVFGAPVWRAEHPSQALSCVLAMHAALQELKREIFEPRGLSIDIGVGVNTGEMVVGNMGSAERFDYTVTGDAVNLASRLEGLTKVYGVFCIVGEGTRGALGPEWELRELDLVQVKGKHTAVPIHELCAGPGRRIVRYEQLERFREGVEAFRAGRFAAARSGFEAFASANPEDVAVRLYLERLASLGEVALEGWSPVTVHAAK